MPQSPEEPIDVQRVLMDRARRMAERDQQPHERPLLPRLVGLGLALVIVLVVLFAFDRFLASMQRFLDLPVVDPEPSVTEPLPAYVVPDDQVPTQDAAPDAAGGQAPADASAPLPAEPVQPR
jgi:hypothetical protein